MKKTDKSDGAFSTPGVMQPYFHNAGNVLMPGETGTGETQIAQRLALLYAGLDARTVLSNCSTFIRSENFRVSLPHSPVARGDEL